MYQQNTNNSGPRPTLHDTKYHFMHMAQQGEHGTFMITIPLQPYCCWPHSTGVINISHCWVMKVHIININPKKKLTEEN